jgi:hypothetical protein
VPKKVPTAPRAGEPESREFREHREKLQAWTAGLAKALSETMPEGRGFALLCFDLGEGGAMAYCSNAKRDDMIKAMQEFMGEVGT